MMSYSMIAGVLFYHNKKQRDEYNNTILTSKNISINTFLSEKEKELPNSMFKEIKQFDLT